MSIRMKTRYAEHSLGEVARFLRGITFKPEDVVEPGTEGSAVCMRTKNVQADLDQADLIAVPRGFVRRDELYLRESDILVSTANSWELVGKCSWVPKLDYDATAGGFISILRADATKVVPRYLYHWFNSDSTQHAVRLCGRQTTNISNMSYERCEALQIPLPPLPEQKRIADILDKADAIRRKRQQATGAFEHLLHSWFMSTVGPDAADYQSWSVRSVDELAEKRPGAIRTGPFGSDLKHSEFVDDGAAVLGIDNAVQNRFAWSERRFITEEKYERLARYRVFPDDVLITIMGTVGRSAVVPNDIPLAINTKHLACISLDKDEAEPEFLSQAIHRHPEVIKQLGLAGRGAIMTGLNLGIIRSISIPVPPISIQRRFHNGVAAIRKHEEASTTAKFQSEDLFNSLVQRAFRGEL